MAAIRRTHAEGKGPASAKARGGGGGGGGGEIGGRARMSSQGTQNT